MCEYWEVEWYDGKVWRGRRYESKIAASEYYSGLTTHTGHGWKRVQLVHTTKRDGEASDTYRMVMSMWVRPTGDVNVRIAT